MYREFDLHQDSSFERFRVPPSSVTPQTQAPQQPKLDFLKDVRQVVISINLEPRRQARYRQFTRRR